ncbi:MAG: DUF1553 domain-containing protein [Planctomycetota bacterium]
MGFSIRPVKLDGKSKIDGTSILERGSAVGPRPPRFPLLAEQNRALHFPGHGARLVIPDLGENSKFDFGDGDAIALEAVLRVEDIGAGENVYLVGKGRTGNVGVAADNQNWALRLRQVGRQTRVSFLFATRGPAETKGGKSPTRWHRWTSDNALHPTRPWNHVLVGYQFGDPTSMVAWINGAPSKGRWDLAGPTKAAPIPDNDDVWIASSMGGQASSSFRGWLDRVAIYRALPSAPVAAGRFVYHAPPAKPPAVTCGEDAVTVSIDAGASSANASPEGGWVDSGDVTSFSMDAFFLHRLPHRYDDFGVRDAWPGPVVLRMAATADLGKCGNELLLRARGLTRLWVDDQCVARLGVPDQTTDAHQPVRPLPERPGPHARRVGYGDRETKITIDENLAGRRRVVLETIVGSKKSRVEPGEALLAIRQSGDDAWTLLRSSGASQSPVLLRDEAIAAHRQMLEWQLDAFDRETRFALAASQDDFWRRRHQRAARWVRRAGPPVYNIAGPPLDNIAGPPLDNSAGLDVKNTPEANGSPAAAEIDRAIDDKIQRLRELADPALGPSDPTAMAAVQSLRERCVRCHGEDPEGGLRLDAPEAVNAVGDSERTAIIAGDPHGSELMRRILAHDPDAAFDGDPMPPDEPLSGRETETLRRWIAQGATWPTMPGKTELSAKELQPRPSLSADDFLRRAALDTVGVIPPRAWVQAWRADWDADANPNATALELRRQRHAWVDRLVNEDRFADHWVSHFQDFLAENPNFLKPALNNTGPFRWFLHESLRDGKPIDRMMTELIMGRGDERLGGAAGFWMAADNDAPLASRAIVMAAAMNGQQLQCARCHDAPYHSWKQQDLYSLAAMVYRKPLRVPESSRVPDAFFETDAGKHSRIEVTLAPGALVKPVWPWPNAKAVSPEMPLWETANPEDSRERLAAHVTSPRRPRFARVIVNQVWARLLGTGLVEPLDDWSRARPSHPQLLDDLSDAFVIHHYDLRWLVATIMKTDLYARQSVESNHRSNPAVRCFPGPDRRRMTAEQIVDSMAAAADWRWDIESLSFDPEAKRPAKTMIDLGRPRAAWMLAALSNERDRPSLSLPRANAIGDVLKAFGWSGARQTMVARRDHQPNVLQPGILSNGVFTHWITTASRQTRWADLAIRAESPGQLIDCIFQHTHSRLPSTLERRQALEFLRDGFDQRVLAPEQIEMPTPLPPLPRVSWSNHLSEQANSIQIEVQRRAEIGDTPDERLDPRWRQRYEDWIWSQFNDPMWVWIP